MCVQVWLRASWLGCLLGVDLSKVLILLPRQLGDILLGLGLAKGLREAGATEVHWYAHPMGKLVLEHHPWVDRVHYYPKGFWNEIRFLWQLRKQNFQIAIDAMANPRTAIACYLTGAATRISFRTRWNRNWAYTLLVDRNKVNKGYVGQTRLELLKPLNLVNAEKSPGKVVESPDGAQVSNVGGGLELDLGVPKLFPLPVEKDRVLAWIKETKLGKFVALSPTHRHGVRKWPAAKFLALAKEIFVNSKVSIVWLWGPGELEEVQKLHNAMLAEFGEGTHLVPLWNLRETAELCSHAELFVGNSNGLSHVAAAGGCKTLVLHGPTSPESWTPPDRNQHRGLQRAEGCVGCQRNTCALQKRECLEDLEVAAVLQQLNSLVYVTKH